MFIYIYIYIYLYIYIVIKQKTNNIFKVKIFRLLPLSIHNLSKCPKIYQLDVIETVKKDYKKSL